MATKEQRSRSFSHTVRNPPPWLDAFKSSSIKTGFLIALTRPQLEYLSAVADDVEWDRANYGGGNPFPENFLATSAALVKRGLIERKKREEVDALHGQRYDSYSTYRLTPAGEHVVALLKLAGLFIEADAAIQKKAKR